MTTGHRATQPTASICNQCVLAHECLSSRGDNEQKQPTCGLVSRIVRSRTHLYRAGEAFDRVYFLRSGVVKAYSLDDDGKEQVVGFYHPGDMLGIDAFGLDAHPTSAVALDTLSLCSLPVSRLLALSAERPEIQMEMVGRMSAQIRAEGNRLAMLKQHGVDERVCAFLLDLAERQRARGFSPLALNLPMSRIDIASYLGMAVETVSRAVTRLQDAGLINASRDRVEVSSLEALRAAAGLAADTWELPQASHG